MTPTPESLILTAAAIEAHAQGKPIQFRNFVHDNGWSDMDRCATIDMLDRLEYRPKPESTTRQWNSPDDVPGPVCWIRGGVNDKYPSMIVGFHEKGVIMFSCLGEMHFYDWENSPSWEHSTDRKTWYPCTVTEDAK